MRWNDDVLHGAEFSHGAAPLFSCFILAQPVETRFVFDWFFEFVL